MKEQCDMYSSKVSPETKTMLRRKQGPNYGGNGSLTAWSMVDRAPRIHWIEEQRRENDRLQRIQAMHGATVGDIRFG